MFCSKCSIVVMIISSLSFLQLQMVGTSIHNTFAFILNELFLKSLSMYVIINVCSFFIAKKFSVNFCCSLYFVSTTLHKIGRAFKNAQPMTGFTYYNKQHRLVKHSLVYIGLTVIIISLCTVHEFIDVRAGLHVNNIIIMNDIGFTFPSIAHYVIYHRNFKLIIVCIY